MNKPFKRIITVMFENQYRNYVIQNPFLKKLAAAGADMTNYFGAFHPSQTNYLASFAGEICGVTNDTPPAAPLMQETLVDILEAKGTSWKAYMEAYPDEPWNKDWQNPEYPATEAPMDQYPPAGDTELSRYYRKHNAFASFHNVQKDQDRWNKIVDEVQFWADVHNDSLPEYSWFTPDIWNDGHYLYNTHIDTNPRTQLVPQLSAWLEHVFFGNIDAGNLQGGSATGLDKLGLNIDVDLLLTNPAQAWKNSNAPEGTLIVVTFDEADYDANGYDTNYDGPNQIYTVLLGDMIKPGTVIDTPYNHYNLIRTVQENFGLNSLNKNDKGANWFRFLWNESFSWSGINDTSFPPATAMGLACGKEGEHLVVADSNGALSESIMGKTGWSPLKALPFKTQGAISMTALNGTSLLVVQGANGALEYASYNSASGIWSALSPTGHNTAGSFAVSAYEDVADAENKLMLCWVDANGFIQSAVGDATGFASTAISTNQLTDGPMTMAQLGGALFLVYKERNTRKMRMCSYNTAPFNAFDAVNFQDQPAPENNTTLREWSVTDFAVGNFAKKMGALANEYQSIGAMCMATADGEMHLVHHGGYSDKNNAYTEIFGLTGIYSAANELTNGYGTLDQAGWTLEEEMSNVNIAVDSPIAMGSNGKQLTLVWSDSKSGTIQFRMGTYSPK